MSKLDFTETLIDRIVRREGGIQYTETPGDRGGGTFMGMTYRAFEQWSAQNLGKTYTPEEYRGAATADPVDPKFIEDVREAYRRIFIRPWDWMIGYPLSDALREMMIDAGVLGGVKSAVRMLQRAVGVNDDGVAGPLTKAAVKDAHAASPRRLLVECAHERCLVYLRIAAADATQDRFLKGWINRVMICLKEVIG